MFLLFCFCFCFDVCVIYLKTETRFRVKNGRWFDHRIRRRKKKVVFLLFIGSTFDFEFWILNRKKYVSFAYKQFSKFYMEKFFFLVYKCFYCWCMCVDISICRSEPNQKVSRAFFFVFFTHTNTNTNLMQGPKIRVVKFGGFFCFSRLYSRGWPLKRHLFRIF